MSPTSTATRPAEQLGIPERADAAEPTRRWWQLRRRSSSRRRALPPHLRRKRRRLLLFSAPFVALALFAAVRLMTLNLVHNETLAGYEAGDKAYTQTWGERQGWVNVVEKFRAPFALGDAQILTGHFDLARPHFERAFAEVPKGGIEECKVRVNLGLTYEQLGDAAKAREREDEWKQFYALGIKTVKERPPFCEAPEGGQTGEQLQQAQQRMEEKNGNNPSEPQPQPDPQQPQPGPSQPQPQPTPNPNGTPSPQEQEELRQQQRQNTIERNQGQPGTGSEPGQGGTNQYPKPW